MLTLQVDQTYNGYFPKDNPDQEVYEHITTALDNQENLIYVAIINNKSAFDPNFLAKAHRFTKDCQKLESVESVHSLTNFKDYSISPFGIVPYAYVQRTDSGNFSADTNRIFHDPRIADR